MKNYKFLLENRETDFREKYTHKFGTQNIERLINAILPKYLDWVGQYMDPLNFEEQFSNLVRAIKTFDKVSNNLPLTDINQYKDLNQFLQAINEYGERVRREVESHPGGNKVYEDNRFYVVNPLTHEASCYYGKGTKWCTASESDYQFKEYNTTGKLFYVIDKTKKTNDPYYKVAILRKFSGEESYWDAKDDSFNKGWILDSNEYKTIEENIITYMNSEFSEQIKIWSDKELAKKEKERLERLRIAQILRQREEEAEERRLEDEWALGPYCPEEGLRAHALLEWLVDTSDVSVLTNEDKIEIERLENEIERLNKKYDDSEDVETDILDEISDLEDELNELKEKIDVYNIIPTGEYYELGRFEVINAGLDDREYAVGDNREMQNSCEEWVDQLIDDTGFGRSAEYFIDEDSVVDYARDYYESDVYDSPESYLDESQRELSTKQKDEIEIINKKISKTETFIEEIESFMDEEEDEEKIEEYEERINELTELIEELESEIEEIEENPDGDFPSELIEEVVDERLDEVRDDPTSFIRNFGLDMEQFINRQEYIEHVIDTDGYGNCISSYDGNADEVTIEGTTYWVIRIN